MGSNRRSFLLAVVVSPVIATAWTVWQMETRRLKVSPQPVTCCVPSGWPKRPCVHPMLVPQHKTREDQA